MQKQTWTIKDILAWTCRYFDEKKVDSSRITSELLLGKALNLPRIKLYMNYDRPLKQAELDLYRSYIQRRVQGEPTQYITGTQEFWSLNFKVTPDVLIPRADTETLIEAVSGDVKKGGRKNISILEIGAGSGAVSVAIAHELKECPVHIKSVDISDKALGIARENAAANGVGDYIDFVLSDKFENIMPDEKYDYIVSNPPYISEEHYQELDVSVKEYEPKIALFGGADGLTFYKEIFSSGHGHLLDGGKIYVEIDFRKRAGLDDLIDRKIFSGITYHKDIAGHDRVLEMKKESGQIG